MHEAGNDARWLPPGILTLLLFFSGKLMGVIKLLPAKGTCLLLSTEAFQAWDIQAYSLPFEYLKRLFSTSAGLCLILFCWSKIISGFRWQKRERSTERPGNRQQGHITSLVSWSSFLTHIRGAPEHKPSTQLSPWRSTVNFQPQCGDGWTSGTLATPAWKHDFKFRVLIYILWWLMMLEIFFFMVFGHLYFIIERCLPVSIIHFLTGLCEFWMFKFLNFLYTLVLKLSSVIFK